MALYAGYYGRWLKDIDLWLSEGLASSTEGPAERMIEPLATCENCLMADSSRLRQVMSESFKQDPHAQRDPGPFKKNLRCCTYQPYLPNFVVGELLSLESPKLMSAFDYWLESGALQPQGLILGTEISAEELAEGFGVDESLLCPFLETKSQLCTIWSHRPAVCSSYHCVSRYGSTGQKFWSEIEGFLNLFEWTLAHESIWRMGWTEDDLERSHEISFAYTDQSLFLDHGGREREFYRQIRDHAHQVTPDEVMELLGEAGETSKATLQDLYRKLKTSF